MPKDEGNALRRYATHLYVVFIESTTQKVSVKHFVSPSLLHKHFSPHRYGTFAYIGTIAPGSCFHDTRLELTHSMEPYIRGLEDGYLLNWANLEQHLSRQRSSPRLRPQPQNTLRLPFCWWNTGRPFRVFFVCDNFLHQNACIVLLVVPPTFGLYCNWYLQSKAACTYTVLPKPMPLNKAEKAKKCNKHFIFN